MRVIVSAVPGSGKTTIMRFVKERMPGVRIVNVGDMISKIAMEKLGIKDRDQLRHRLTIEQQRKFQEQTAKEIAKMKDADVIIDTHTSVKTPHGFFPGLSEETAHRIKPDVIVFIEYEPRDVVRRRKNDDSRKRDDESEREIAQHQESGKKFAFDAASHVQAAVKVIDLRYREKEPFEHARKAADEIVKLFERQNKTI